ncbi:spore germination protein [Paenibacillus nasutitermitis]|uniref:Spore germination protein n=1 Tax=Paenibacillus nasutitermitis TaxID=1652958 RepID=A0A917DNY8_9BACL|nr:spore germination protein [Paenibacillus nasutitermitis]GGD57055.1 spore germination protein [Paenibacillus nasutitermitis]
MSISSWLRNKKKRSSQKSPAWPQPGSPDAGTINTPGTNPSESFKDRLQWFRQELADNSDLIVRTFCTNSGAGCAILYYRGMVDQKTIQEDILNGLFSLEAADAAVLRRQVFDLKQLPVADMKITANRSEGIMAILNGHVLLLIDGDQRMADFPVCSFQKRAIEEAPNESVLRGPRESFIESLEVNLTLIRRKIKTRKFKTESMLIGTETQTEVVIAYVQGTCKQELVDEVKKRLSSIQIDSILGNTYLEEFIEDSPYSPFPQLQYTERPDVVVASVLEGRVAIIVDGTPIVLLAPVTLFMLLQAAEDYYQRYVAASWIRWIRFIFLFLSLLLPSTYIAITTFHTEMIPERLLISIAASREVVPFPALIEALIMEIAFEALREAAVRIPKAIGQAVSIIGALIIGTAAVEAGIVSAFMVIIVSLTGIASFIVPHFDLGLALRLLRFPIMILAGVFGLFGIACGMLLIYLHLINLNSFGTPYLTPVAPLNVSDLKDTLWRAPRWFMHKWPSMSDKQGKLRETNTRPWRNAEEGDTD